MPSTALKKHPSHISMGSISGLEEFQQRLNVAKERLIEGVKRLMEQTVEKWVAAAKRRVPVDLLGPHPGQLRDSIEGEVQVMGSQIIGAIGTNVEYATFVEFGTRAIAGGRVLALGETPDITDAEAVYDWPAKDERGGGNDQMPWMRPAWWEIEPWFMEQLGLIIVGAFRA